MASFLISYILKIQYGFLEGYRTFENNFQYYLFLCVSNFCRFDI